VIKQVVGRLSETSSPLAGGDSLNGAGSFPMLESPDHRRRVSSLGVAELLGSAVAALAFVFFLIYVIEGIDAAFGLFVCWYLTFVTVYGVVCWRNHGLLAMKQRLAALMTYSGGVVALVSLGAVILDVIFKGSSVAFADFPHFFYADMTQLSATAPVTAVGVGPAIVGTVEQVGLAALFTVPIGILTAIYLVEARGPFPRVVAAVVDAMTGSPAIIAGLFVYLFWVAPRHETGKSGFAAALALSVMMLPMATRASQEVIAVVPGSLREAALALGSPEWRVALFVVLPTARAGLANAVILAIARVTGESAPILFDVGGNSRYNWNPFRGQQDNLAFRIYQLIFQPGVNTTRLAWGTGFVLVLLVFGLFLLARLLGRSTMGRSRFRQRFSQRLRGARV
jgi:phosphate transport system permease protein